MSIKQLKKTALNQVHKSLGGKMIDFGGWELPIQYRAGTIEEHLAVRKAVGIFDVSHMGEIEIRGPQALALIQYLTCNDAAKLADGQIQYSALTNSNGGFIDDILVHRLSRDHYFLCVNASNDDKDWAWILGNSPNFAAEVKSSSDKYTQLAIQGPLAQAVMQPLVDLDLTGLKHYWFARSHVDGVPAIIARTGYTGEDGFEIYFDPGEAERVWQKIMETGAPFGLVPCGLAARNTLRLEAKMALFGNDIDETTTVFEADLGRICRFDKGDFIGRERLAEQKDIGVSRKLAGFEVTDKGIARDHCPVFIGGRETGVVTSGSPAPFLKKNIGLAYLPIAQTAIGTRFEIDVRGRRVAAEVVRTPFYKRSK